MVAPAIADHVTLISPLPSAGELQVTLKLGFGWAQAGLGVGVGALVTVGLTLIVARLQFTAGAEPLVTFARAVHVPGEYVPAAQVYDVLLVAAEVNSYVLSLVLSKRYVIFPLPPATFAVKFTLNGAGPEAGFGVKVQLTAEVQATITLITGVLHGPGIGVQDPVSTRIRI